MRGALHGGSIHLRVERLDLRQDGLGLAGGGQLQAKFTG